ncbi:hypothetical protein ACRE1S_02510 [Helicobacter himalayensis]|uniref:hypothetical protein n=1 Tax=Helicobacter himalayensis TaxID=1591088 RepID=UPI003D7019B1
MRIYAKPYDDGFDYTDDEQDEIYEDFDDEDSGSGFVGYDDDDYENPDSEYEDE